MPPRTVLHLIDTGGPGGAETVFLNLVDGLDRSRWRSVAVVPELDWLDSALRDRGVDPVLVATDGSFDIRYLRQLTQLVRRYRVDLIQTHLLTTAVYGGVAGRIAGVPVVSTFHGEVDVPFIGMLSTVKSRIIRSACDRIVFVSEALRTTLAPRLQATPSRTLVIHNGIDTVPRPVAPRKDTRREFGAGVDDILVGAIGNLRVSKDYPTFIEAAAILSRASDRFRFVIAGDTRGGMHDDLHGRAAAAGLTDRFVFAGFRTDVHDVLASLDVLVVSSSAEGFSLVVLEALAAGVPIVSTRCGGPEEIVSHEHDALLVPTRDPASLADAVLRIIAEPQLARQLTVTGRRTLEARFSRSAMIDAYQSVYSTLTHRPDGERAPLTPAGSRVFV